MTRRVLTAIMVVTACVWTAAQGLGFVRFDDDTAAQLREPVESGDLDGLAKREEALVRLLSERPGASSAWLSLAAVRYSLAKPQDKIEAAYIMSGVTGPSEGALMAERSLLGVLLWEMASPDVHARTMKDLCGLGAFDPWRLRLAVTTKAEAVRAQIRAGLVANGCPAATIKTVGL